MGIFADTIDELNDRGCFDGAIIGWSSINLKIKYSSRESKIMSSLGISHSLEISSSVGSWKEVRESSSFACIAL